MWQVLRWRRRGLGRNLGKRTCNLMQTWRLRANLAEARGWRNPARNLPKPGEAGRNPAEPGGTRRNLAEPGGNLAEPTTPPSTNFFSARFPPGFRRVPPGSAGFRRVPPGSAGFRRVPPGSAGFRRVPPGFAGFRGVQPLRWVLLDSAGFQAFARSVPPACAGFCRFRQQGSCYRLPFNSLLGLCQVLARRLSRLQQSKKRFLQVPGHCPSRLMEKITNKVAFLVQ